MGRSTAAVSARKGIGGLPGEFGADAKRIDELYGHLFSEGFL